MLAETKLTVVNAHARTLEGLEIPAENRTIFVRDLDHGVAVKEMDGLEATRQIRAREAVHGGRTPIIAMTANAMTGDRDRCLDSGMDDYISKPMSRRALEEAIHRASPVTC